MESIDVRLIVRNHLASLRLRSRPVSFGHLLLFVLLPIGAGAALAVFGAWPQESAKAPLLTAVSVVAGLMLNLLVLVHSLYNRMPDTRESARARQVARETHSNIAFATLWAILLILLLVPYPASIASSEHWIVVTIRVVTNTLLMQLFLTLLLVLRRAHALFEHDFA